jgi:hypothetical protein
MISGRAFADIATWIYDDRYPDKSFSKILSRNGDRVFMNGDMFDRFLEEKTASIFSRNKKFVYIIHNSDAPFDRERLYRLLPHALHIYAINTSIRHPQLTTIPIGFPDSGLKHVNIIRPLLPEHRDIEVYSNFTFGTNVGARYECWSVLKDDPRMYPKIPAPKTQPEFYADMCRSKFVLCPVGTGVDTHRVYEALACGATPVVLHSSLDHLYAKLPVCILDKWTDPLYVPEGRVLLDVHSFL